MLTTSIPSRLIILKSSTVPQDLEDFDRRSLEHLNEVTRSYQSFRHLRETIRAVAPNLSCIPYLGVYILSFF